MKKRQGLPMLKNWNNKGGHPRRQHSFVLTNEETNGAVVDDIHHPGTSTVLVGMGMPNPIEL
jgi:hypothetical protein